MNARLQQYRLLSHYEYLQSQIYVSEINFLFQDVSQRLSHLRQCLQFINVARVRTFGHICPYQTARTALYYYHIARDQVSPWLSMPPKNPRGRQKAAEIHTSGITRCTTDPVHRPFTASVDTTQQQ